MRRRPGPRSLVALQLSAMIDDPARDFDRALLRLALAKQPHLPALRLLLARQGRSGRPQLPALSHSRRSARSSPRSDA